MSTKMAREFFFICIVIFSYLVCVGTDVLNIDLSHMWFLGVIALTNEIVITS